ncbi:myosin-2 heavy chain [Anopheles darlingi]|uniref:myosin-2 heavy chain n=1 Tax=Anopheles darlingi TaxID=43151 RepID=UPI002100320D|nr:myosin-2 heavy chain [Anopheles darlingi]XP_049538264.1 myosin-2 heavy chain [Anopheles darlingi]XP_049538265.1 myosin-2 heavy chain [Anopheles darlingi]XP_049538266.1 myosin-2 heavy chain [Anopheles darlingi]XP_049538267.1 myosin-2 heavy chain [Anopheles darlingi]XP_049538268.1 myosin-2 heavy chain [Anopheles darlingi]
MSHLFPSAKGDQLCPLGFHPQVRWPTRCKRCFRDYKEHGNKRNGDDIAASTPVLPGSTQSRNRDSGSSTTLDKPVRSWTSTQNLFSPSGSNSHGGGNSGTSQSFPQRPASWASTPDLDNILQNVKADFTVNLPLPRRRHTTTFDNIEETNSTTVTIKRPPLPPILKVDNSKKEVEKVELLKREDSSTDIVIEKSDSLAERVRKLNLMKRQGSAERDTSKDTETDAVVSAKMVLKPSKPEPEAIPVEKVERRRRKPIPETPADSSGTISAASTQTSAKLSTGPKSATAATSTSSSSSTSSLAGLTATKDKTSGAPGESASVATKTTIRRRRIEESTNSGATATTKPALTVSTPSITSIQPKNGRSIHTDSQVPASSSDDVKFLISIKDKKMKTDDDMHSTTTDTTEATEATIVDHINTSELQEEIESLKRELETVKARAERAERDKSDILLRRLASIDTVSNKTAASEALKLQQKVNEQKQLIDDLQDEKKFLTSKLKEMSADLNARGSRSMEEQLRQKLEQAETLCEELMDENEEIKRELRNMETEIEEMHDNFREDQADEYASLKKELDQTTKNCRILSFKLKKSDRRIEQLEAEKATLGASGDLAAKIKQLEDELKVSNEVARRLQAELESAAGTASTPSTPTKKTPTLGNIGKSTSADSKISRASLTRGGSQEDPAQLLRDLQDSLEREADLREQLKYAEEEAENLRRKSSRVEDENDSLVMQLKKMASKAKTKSIFSKGRKLSPAPTSRSSSEPSPIEKDEGISDEEDPAELRLQLELNEQEMAVFRRKIEELELENKHGREQIKDLQESLASKTKELGKKLPSFIGNKGSSSPGVKDPLEEKKITVMEDEISELRKKLIEKDREFERLQAEMALAKSKGGKTLSKSKSLETITEQQAQDLKRQIQVVEQEATVLRAKTQSLEQENEKYQSEIKSLQQQARKSTGTSAADTKKLNDTIDQLQKDNQELDRRLQLIIKESSSQLPARLPKNPTDMHTKLQMKKMIDECETEISDLRAILGKTGGMNITTLEKDKRQLEAELNEIRQQRDKLSTEIGVLKKETLEQHNAKLNEAQRTVEKLEDENKKQNDKIKTLEDKINRINSNMKAAESSKTFLETQLKSEKEKHTTAEKDLEKLRKEKSKMESRLGDMEKELQLSKKNAEVIKENLEREITSLKSKTNGSEQDSASSKILQELKKQNEDLTTEIHQQNRKFEELLQKHETMEEEHLVLRAQLASEREKSQESEKVKEKLIQSEAIETRLVKENTNLSRKLVEAQKKLATAEASTDNRVATIELERNRMKSSLEDKQNEFEKLLKENEMNSYQVNQLKKDNEDLRGKLDDYERINKTQRTLSEHNAQLEQELKSAFAKLEASEMTVKSEVAATRLRYEQQVTNLHNELTAMQRQCERFKRDRDTFKQLVEAAQKQIGDMKANRRSIASVTSSSDDDDKTKIVALEQQIGCLEDELSEARLEASKVRTELVSELSASEIKISEMQSKINELEEEKIMGSGKSKVPGTKTRLELSWQKEREELQRLVQETSTLARDLRQTLYEVERERDKEKLESKRKVDQIKKTTEEEIEEGRRKVTELQSDLLELRDAHAKLRTANEKLRRDRDRYEKERESVTRRRLEAEGDRRIAALLQTVDELVKLAPDMQKALPKDSVTTSTGKTITANTPIPTPPMRHKSPSPGPGGSNPQQSITTVLARVAEASEDLRRYQRLCDEEKDRERVRRGGIRRAASQENEAMHESAPGRPVVRVNRNGGSLYRKSLSLDQSMQAEQQGLIWKEGDDSMSSLQSIDSDYGMMRRDSSLDSRLSTGSTQSDMPRMRKKKRGIMGKLRSLSLTRSKGTESDYSHQGSDSDLSLAGDIRSSKTNLKGKLSGMFRRGGSSSRTNSTEAIDREAQRPVAIQTLGNGPTGGPTSQAQLRPVSASTPHLARTGKPPTPSMMPSTQRKRLSANLPPTGSTSGGP